MRRGQSDPLLHSSSPHPSSYKSSTNRANRRLLRHRRHHVGLTPCSCPEPEPEPAPEPPTIHIDPYRLAAAHLVSRAPAPAAYEDAVESQQSGIPTEHLKLALSVLLPEPAPPGSDATSASTTSSKSSKNRARARALRARTRVLAVVSNVQAGWEQAALLLLRPRWSDGARSSACQACWALVPGLQVQLGGQLGRAAGEKEGEAKEGAASGEEEKGRGSSRSELRISGPSAPSHSIALHSEDERGVQDLLAVVRSLLEVSRSNDSSSSSWGSSNKEYGWLGRYSARPLYPSSLPPALEPTSKAEAAAGAATPEGETPIFSRFTSSSFAPPPSSASCSALNSPTIEHPDLGELKISIGSWNVNGQMPPVDGSGAFESSPSSAAPTAGAPDGSTAQPGPGPTASQAAALARWLRLSPSSHHADPTGSIAKGEAGGGEDPDVLVLGFQEFDPSSTAYLYYSNAREHAWVQAVYRIMDSASSSPSSSPSSSSSSTKSTVAAGGAPAREYVKLHARQMVGLITLVFVRRTLARRFVDVQSATVGVGLGGVMANKGAVAVRFRFVPPGLGEAAATGEGEGAGAASASQEGGEDALPAAGDGDPSDADGDATRLIAAHGAARSRGERRGQRHEHGTAYGQSFCFVNAHLSAFDGAEAVERRRWDYAEIMRRMRFELDLGGGGGGGHSAGRHSHGQGRAEALLGVGRLMAHPDVVANAQASGLVLAGANVAEQDTRTSASASAVAAGSGTGGLVEVAPIPSSVLAATQQLKGSPELALPIRDMAPKERKLYRRWRRKWARERAAFLHERRKWAADAHHHQHQVGGTGGGGAAGAAAGGRKSSEEGRSAAGGGGGRRREEVKAWVEDLLDGPDPPEVKAAQKAEERLNAGANANGNASGALKIFLEVQDHE